MLVTTKGVPYLVTGSGPDTMTAIRIESSHANLNKRSMVDMGPYVIYASPDGLVAAEGTTVETLQKA